MDKTYRALITTGLVPNVGTPLHLTPDDSDASLCGIPRAALRPGGILDDVVCRDCIEWLPKRLEASRKMRWGTGEEWRKAAT